MVLRLALLAFVGLGLAGFGMFAWVNLRTPPAAEVAAGAPVAAPAPAARVAVLVAARALRVGSLLKPEDIAAREMPASEAPVEAATDTPAARSEMIGAMVRRTLIGNEAILPGDVLRPGDHGFLAAVLDAGMRAVTVGVDAISGTAGLIWPGDRVDLILTQKLDDSTLPLARKVSSETVLADVRVIAIDQRLLQGAAGNPTADATQTARTVTLEVTPNQAERVTVAAHLGTLALAVRAAMKAEPGVLPAVAAGVAGAAEKDITWAGDVSPALSAGGGSRAANATVRLFMGGGKTEEFRY